jgi:glycerol-3-phosphate dehydrogenase
MDRPEKGLLAPSQGVHLVVDRSKLPITSAMMLPKTDDGRVLFAIPWRSVVIVGTTDTPISEPTLEPRAQQSEITFILETLNRYLEDEVTRDDVRSVFAGIRPLVGRATNGTAGLSRDHTLWADPVSRLITITGGKWTTYREMAEATVDLAAQVAKLLARPCRTEELPIHGATDDHHADPDLAWYGSDAARLLAVRSEPGNDSLIHPDLPIKRGDVTFACRAEMARTVDDVLARRSRSLLLNAQASMESAEKVAQIMAAELDRDEDWVQSQTLEFKRLAANYML